MEFSIATILAQFSDNKLVAGKILEKKLGCEDEENNEKLQLILDVLEKIGVLTKEFGKYRRVIEEDVVEAKLRCSSKGFCFAIQDEEAAEDIYIRESHLSNAWNGDRVLVKIIKEGSRRRSPEGEVKLILERANPSVLARVVKDNGNYRAIPLDDRLLFELILKENGENLSKAHDHLVHVAVVRYPIAQYPPFGKVTKILGSDAEEAADTDIVCCKHDLPIHFSQKVIDSAKTLKEYISPYELRKREDFRSTLTVTIEEESDREKLEIIENAFSVTKTKEGYWQLAIHVADIDYYIEPDSLLDREAKKRVTAIHLNNKVLPLFPEEVYKLFSLTSDKDCLAVSILINLDETGEIVEFNIVPSLIRVDYQFSYQEIQSILGNTNTVDPQMTEVIEMLNDLFFTLSSIVKAKRLLRGGFEISLPENHLGYKDEGRLGVILDSPTLPVKSLLTELAVLGGKVIADHLNALNIPAIYCTQSEPDWDELQDLLQLGNNLHLDLKLEVEEEIRPRDYQRFTQKFSKSPSEKVLQYILQSTLKLSKYSTKPGNHFGLAYEDAYTHCISPGKRYADLLIQRILKAIFEYGRDRRHNRTKQGVSLGSSTCHGLINWNVLPPQIEEEINNEIVSVISHLNEKEKEAEDAERDLEGLKKAEKMKECTGQIFRGLITGVQSYGFFVQIDELLVEGLVHVSSLKDDWYDYRSRHHCLVGKKNRIAYCLGDHVEVEVKSVDYYRQQIDLVTVGGGSTASNEVFDDY